MAVKKTVEIDIKSNSKKADKDLKEIKKDIDAIGKSAKKNLSGENAKKLNKELDKTAEAAKNTKTRLRELEDELADIGDVNSPQFQKLAKEAGVLRDKMNNAKAAVRSMSEDFPRLQLGTQAFQAIGGAAQGAMGAAALFGSENEEVTKSIQKLIAVQSVLNSVDAVAKSLGDETALGLKARVFWAKIQRKEGQKYTLATIRQTVAQGGLNAAQAAGAVGMKILNGIMAINPVFLLITGFAALAAGIAWFASRTEDAAAENDKLNASFDRSMNKMKARAEYEKIRSDEKLREISAETAKAIALRKAEQDEELATMVDGTQKKKDLQKQFDDELYNMQLDANKNTLIEQAAQAKKDEAARIEEISRNRKAIKAKNRIYKAAVKNEQFEKAADIRKEREGLEKRNRDLIKLNQEYHTKKQELESEGHTLIAEQRSRDAAAEAQSYNERVQRYKEYKQLLADTDKLIKDKENALIEDDVARQEAIALTKRDRDLAAVKGSKEQQAKLKILIEEEYQAKLKTIHEKEEKQTETHEDKLRDIKQKAADDWAMEEENLSEIIRQAGQTDRQNEIDALNDHYFNLIETAKQHNLDVTALEQEQADKLAAIDKEAADEKKANEKEVLDAKLSMASDTFGALGDLATAFAKDDEKSAERAFKINKAVGIAQAVISTAQGVINAYANPVDVASGVAFGKSAIIAATGAAQIATIAKSKFQGGGAAGSSPTAPSSTAPSAASQPASFNVVGNTGVNQLAETLGNQGQQPIQAFVVGSEVTTQQSLDRNKVETATL